MSIEHVFLILACSTHVHSSCRYDGCILTDVMMTHVQFFLVKKTLFFFGRRWDLNLTSVLTLGGGADGDGKIAPYVLLS